MPSSSVARRPASPRCASAAGTPWHLRWSGWDEGESLERGGPLSRLGARGGHAMTLQTESIASGPSAEVKQVAVVGGGTMGNGIAQVFATAGFEVELVDSKPDFVSRALATIAKNVERVAKKQEWPAE